MAIERNQVLILAPRLSFCPRAYYEELSKFGHRSESKVVLILTIPLYICNYYKDMSSEDVFAKKNSETSFVRVVLDFFFLLPSNTNLPKKTQVKNVALPFKILISQ